MQEIPRALVLDIVGNHPRSLTTLEFTCDAPSVCVTPDLKYFAV